MRDKKHFLCELEVEEIKESQELFVALHLQKQRVTRQVLLTRMETKLRNENNKRNRFDFWQPNMTIEISRQLAHTVKEFQPPFNNSFFQWFQMNSICIEGVRMMQTQKGEMAHSFSG